MVTVIKFSAMQRSTSLTGKILFFRPVQFVEFFPILGWRKIPLSLKVNSAFQRTIKLSQMI
jgi:hypothetical protein